jgi:hypothetical protein
VITKEAQFGGLSANRKLSRNGLSEVGTAIAVQTALS